MSFLDLHPILNQFAINIYEQIRTSTEIDRNVVISPLSINVACTLALIGASGDTAKEIARRLQMPSNADQSVIANEFEKLLVSLRGRLQLANKMYMPSAYKFKPAFQTIAEKLASETQTLDFGSSDEAAHKINEWINYKTGQRIKVIISPDLLDEGTKLVLANGMFFKGLWDHQFDADDTKRKPFFNSPTESVPVDMMYKRAIVPFADLKDLSAKVIVLDFENSTLSMVIVLPNERNGLAALDAHMRQTSLASIVCRTESKSKVIISLPKFRIEMQVELSDSLRKIGMLSMFSREAEFNGLMMVAEKKQPIYVTDIVHKAVIEVNEKGTVASAATKLDLLAMSKKMELVTFNADHPFRFFIRTADNIVLVCGCFRFAGVAPTRAK